MASNSLFAAAAAPQRLCFCAVLGASCMSRSLPSAHCSYLRPRYCPSWVLKFGRGGLSMQVPRRGTHHHNRYLRHPSWDGDPSISCNYEETWRHASRYTRTRTRQCHTGRSTSCAVQLGPNHSIGADSTLARRRRPRACRLPQQSARATDHDPWQVRGCAKGPDERLDNSARWRLMASPCSRQANGADTHSARGNITHAVLHAYCTCAVHTEDKALGEEVPGLGSLRDWCFRVLAQLQPRITPAWGGGGRDSAATHATPHYPGDLPRSPTMAAG